MNINCYIDEQTLKILEKAAEDLGRTVMDLAESAVSEAAVAYKRDVLDLQERGRQP